MSTQQNVSADQVPTQNAAVGAAVAPHASVTDDPRRWITLAILSTGLFMALLDVTIVNVALPTIQLKLHASGGALQLVVSGFTISYAMLLITGARLGELRGARTLFEAGVIVFTLSSLACGLSPNVTVLIAARFLQGVGAAAMTPQLLSVIQRQFTGTDRLRALSIYAATIATGSVVGQVLGGVLIRSNLFGLSWRVVFLVNVPVGAVLALLVPRYVPGERLPQSRRVDVAGLIASSISVMLIVVPLVLGHQEGWPAWSWISLALGLVGVAVFVRIERMVRAKSGHPILNLAIFQSRGMVPAIAALAAGMVAYGGFLFSFALHLQLGLGDSALRAGLTFAPAAATFGAMGLLWRKLPSRLHHLLPPVGFAVAALSYLALAADLRGGHRNLTLYLLLLVLGIGMGAAFSPIVTLALVNVPRYEAPDASGLLTTSMQLSQVIGVAVFGSLFLSTRAHPHAHASAHAITVVDTWIALLMAVGIVAAVQLSRAVKSAIHGA
jgi:EmrB/QacA subfamily drug resistance transporter